MSQTVKRLRDPDDYAKALKDCYEVLRRDQADTRERIQQALNVWLENCGHGGEPYLYDVLWQWAEHNLLRLCSASQEQSQVWPDLRLMTAQSFWDMWTRQSLPPDLVNSCDALYKALFGDDLNFHDLRMGSTQ